ncbi:MAG: class I SAM-dependent methyltransferase [Thermoanaerobaculales bacterium]|nr:class I SAM-dependent methyltransferase [Thermoanaerobaculales bacterium]
MDRLIGEITVADEERPSLLRLMELLIELPPPPRVDDDFPRYGELKEAFVRSCGGEDAEIFEESFLELYAHLHMHEASYTPCERRRMDSTGGYWAHAGGLSPILRAGPWLAPESRSVDLGAGNGLQALLMQRLYPHDRCCQVEISASAVEIGRRLQGWLGIPDGCVEWRVDDVLETPLGGWDFVYLYRPVRPDGPGRVFYERLAAALHAEPGEVVVFSIADCLGDFLPSSFHRFYSDGHLTCFRKL